MKRIMYTNDSQMIMGLDYDLSYVPGIAGDALLLMITLATSKGTVFHSLCISIALISIVIYDPSKIIKKHTLLWP